MFSFVASSVIGGGEFHIFVFTHLESKRNVFLKKLIMWNTNISILATNNRFSYATGVFFFSKLEKMVCERYWLEKYQILAQEAPT